MENKEIVIEEVLMKRNPNSNKGTYGKVGIIAGSRGMTGAVYLAAMGALRSGAGLVYSLIPESLMDIMSIKLTEVIVRPIKDRGGHFIYDSIRDIVGEIEEMDALGIGPGMGVDKEIGHLLGEIIKNYKKPIVIDADGINCLANSREILDDLNQTIIITPHPGEMSRLIDRTIGEIQENRLYYAKKTAEKYNLIVVLKGNESIVACPDGRSYINNSGNPGMATAGSGDILTGMIVSLLAQNIEAFEAAAFAVYAHGLAGDLSRDDKGEYGLIATDILENIPYGIKEIIKS